MTGAAFTTVHTHPPRACTFLGAEVYNVFQEKKTGEWNLQDKHFSQSIPGHLLLKFCSCSFSFLPTPKDDSGKGEKRKSKSDEMVFLATTRTPPLLDIFVKKRLSEIGKMRSDFSRSQKKGVYLF